APVTSPCHSGDTSFAFSAGAGFRLARSRDRRQQIVRDCCRGIHRFHPAVTDPKLSSVSSSGSHRGEVAGTMLGGSGRWVVWVAFLVALGRGNAPAEEPTPPGAVGTIKGVVLDKTSGDPVIEAGVEVVGTGVKAKTD